MTANLRKACQRNDEVLERKTVPKAGDAFGAEAGEAADNHNENSADGPALFA
jgi:hypothetical protein